MPTNEGVPWPTTMVTAGNQAGANEEPYSYHPGGVNALFGDGSVHFIKDTVNLVAFRSLLSLNRRETHLRRPVLRPIGSANRLWAGGANSIRRPAHIASY